MSQSKFMHLKSTAAAAIIVSALSVTTIPAIAQQVPVTDQQVAQEVTKVAQNTQTQIEYLREIRDLTRQILEAVGGEGASSMAETFGGGGGPGGGMPGGGGGMPGMPGGAGGGMPGMPGMPGGAGGGPWDMFAGGGGFLQQLSQVMPMAEQLMGMFGGMGGVGGDAGGGGFGGGAEGLPTGSGSSASTVGSRCSNVNFSNIEQVRDCLDSAFYVEGAATEADRIAVRGNRNESLRNTATSTMSIALATRNNAAQAAERSQALEGMVSSASTLREDLKAGNAVLLAVHQELGSLQALYAAYTELYAASIIASDGSIERASSSSSVSQPGENSDN